MMESKEGFLHNEGQIKDFSEAKYGYFIGVRGNNTKQQLQKLRKSIIVSSIQMVFSVLPIAGSYAFGCLFAAALEANSRTEQEMDKISESLSLVHTRLNERINYTPQGLPENFDTSYLSTIGTADVFRATKKFISKNTVDNLDTFIPPFQPDQCINAGTSSLPTIVFTENHLDASQIINAFAMQRVRLHTIVSLSLTDNIESAQITERMLSTAVKQSSMAMLHYIEPSEKGASVISDVFYKTKQGTADPSFKLVIICSSTRFLPIALIVESKKIEYENPYVLRSYMQQMFGRYSSYIQSSTNALQIKKLCYPLLLELGLNETRNLMRPGGFTDLILILALI